MINNNKLELENKVILNKYESINLFKIDINENENINLKKLNNTRPIGYHQFCFDPIENTYKSIDKNDDKVIGISKNQYLYSNNIKFVHERENEMGFICPDTNSPSACLWSWEFGSELEISKLLLNILFMTLEQNSNVEWYFTNEISNGLVMSLRNKSSQDTILNSIEKEFIKMPLVLQSPFYFDKKLNCSKLVNGSSSFYLSCIMKNNSPHNSQLFRSKLLPSSPITNTLHSPQKFNYPFNIYFELSLKNKSSSNGSGSSCASINTDLQNKEGHGPFKFIEENENIESIVQFEKFKVELWNKNRVGDWLFDNGFYELIERFDYLNINGKKLISCGIGLLPNIFTQNQVKKNQYIKSLNKLLELNNLSQIPTNQEPTLAVNPLNEFKFSNPYKENSILVLSGSGSNNNSNIQFSNEEETNNDEESNLIFNDKESYDYKVIVQDSTFYVHKSILSKNSDYFKYMLEHSSHTFMENKLNISIFETSDHLTVQSMEMLMELVYLESSCSQELLSFFKKLDIYQLKQLLNLTDRFLFKQKKLIEKYLIWSINSENLSVIDKEFNNNNEITQFTKFYLKNI